MFNIVLVEPEIPANTGNIAVPCAHHQLQPASGQTLRLFSG